MNGAYGAASKGTDYVKPSLLWATYLYPNDSEVLFHQSTLPYLHCIFDRSAIVIGSGRTPIRAYDAAATTQ